MLALTVDPKKAGSLDVREVADPRPAAGELLVQGIAIGVCGTDREIAANDYGSAPPGKDRLILGHESLGRVVQAPPESGFAPGDLVAGVVRRPDPVPCGACAQGEFDMCRNGLYVERGIKDVDGFGSQLWTIEPSYAVKLDPSLGEVGMLMEPTSVVAKAWEQVELVGRRSWFDPKRVLVTGAGPIGLLAAMLGVQRGLDVHVLDLATSGPKPDAVAALGAEYHSSGIDSFIAKGRPDIVIEATGVSEVVIDAIGSTAAYGIVCLTGVSPGGRRISVDVGGANRSMVLENDAVVGSVNANLRHFAAAAESLRQADPTWLARLITQRISLNDFAQAFTHPDPDTDIKSIITL
ncbi:glucose 1-dehydrogenase [Allorhizocola rhizosphaerae]|uniref:glucose 1-dehydrogenase n=1 Tax=Allorhizocola rhizosphaerae TaxID=1872709 RepID=UPI000E3C7FAE|nr:glucose 1-dehydrogenase [Allorhizocola rhizosphaerae]